MTPTFILRSRDFGQFTISVHMSFLYAVDFFSHDYAPLLFDRLGNRCRLHFHFLFQFFHRSCFIFCCHTYIDWSMKLIGLIIGRSAFFSTEKMIQRVSFKFKKHYWLYFLVVRLKRIVFIFYWLQLPVEHVVISDFASRKIWMTFSP